MDEWYFAYGSNLWVDQMIARTGTLHHAQHLPSIARLANHRLVFQCLKNGGAAYANIVCPGDGVLGVLYRCSPANLEKLDRYEQGYDRQPITVTLLQGEELAAVVYVMRPTHEMNTAKPTAEYLQKIVTGARQHDLPSQYIDHIIRVASPVVGQADLLHPFDS